MTVSYLAVYFCTRLSRLLVLKKERDDMRMTPFSLDGYLDKKTEEDEEEKKMPRVSLSVTFSVYKKTMADVLSSCLIDSFSLPLAVYSVPFLGAPE